MKTLLLMLMMMLPSVSQAEWGDDEYCELFGAGDFYCIQSWWASTTPFHLKRVSFHDDAGWGFDMDAISPMPVNSGAENGKFVAYFQEFIYYSENTIGGRDIRLEFWGSCSAWISGYPCYYALSAIELGEGWVLDNGIDFSGQMFEFEIAGWNPSDLSLHGHGANYPWTPFNPDYPMGTLVPLEKETSIQIEDYFGIHLEIELDPQQETFWVPEPAMGASLAAGVMMIAMARRRR